MKAHQRCIRDPEVYECINGAYRSGKVCCGYLFKGVSSGFVAIFFSVSDKTCTESILILYYVHNKDSYREEIIHVFMKSFSHSKLLVYCYQITYWGIFEKM